MFNLVPRVLSSLPLLSRCEKTLVQAGHVTHLFPATCGGVRPSLRQIVITSAMFYSSLHFAIVNSHLYSSIILKPKQVKCLEAVYFGRDVIAVLPTGYGKSLIFHLLPSLFYDKLTSASNKRAVIIVVSPLNALIENQTKKSYQGNIKAGMLNVKKGKHDEDLRLNLVGTDLLLRDAMYDIIYMHPEAFLSCKEGMELLQSVPYQKSVRAIMKLIVFSNGMYVDCEIEVHVIIYWHLPIFQRLSTYILQGTRLQERLLKFGYVVCCFSICSSCCPHSDGQQGRCYVN